MKKIITDQEIQQQAKGNVFLVEANMILTPSARDYALNKGITLEYASRNSTAGPPAQTSLEEAVRDIILAELGDVAPETHAALMEGVKESLAGPATTPTPPKPPTPMPQMEVQGASANMGKRAVITTTGNNGQGIAAKVTSVISEAGGDIVDISQTLVGQYFTMILVVDLSNMATSGMTFHAFRQKLEAASDEIGIAITVMHEDILNAMHRI